MKAARINDYGTPPMVKDVPVPHLGAEEVLVRVAGASLNPLDVKMQSGIMRDFFPIAFPYTMGTDVSGTIVQVGTAVSDWHKGDTVVARADPMRGGAIAEFVAIPAAMLVKAPMSLPIEQAAGIATTGGTAWQALHEIAQVSRGQTVLIHAGAGGVGSFAVQFARAAGARVTATASGDGLEIVRQLGADRAIDHRAEDFTRALSDVDLVLDTIGGETQQRSFEVLRSGGLLLSTVSPPDEALAAAHKVRSAFVIHQSDADRLAKVVDAVDGGTRLLVDRILPLADLPNAFALQASGRTRGKIVLLP